jgi:hypothetical protein
MINYKLKMKIANYKLQSLIKSFCGVQGQFFQKAPLVAEGKDKEE